MLIKRPISIAVFGVFLSGLLGVFGVFGMFGATVANAQNAQKPQSFRQYWPPQLNSYYPEIELMTTAGRKVKLSSYAGKVLLVEPIGMSCSGCQAFAGADKRGGFQGVAPQAGIPSIDTLLMQNGISPSDSRLLRVQLLLYNVSLGAPSLEQAQAWAKHFGFAQRPNELVLIGDSRFISDASYNMIPGFQLIDRNYVLRSDSTGHTPKNDLYKHLLPLLKQML